MPRPVSAVSWFADFDEAEAAALLRKLTTYPPAKVGQLSDKPAKLEQCPSCSGVVNLLTGECDCSD